MTSTTPTWQEFDSLNPGERRRLGFDFSADMSAADSLVDGSQDVTISLESGIDASPSARLEGAAVIEGKAVMQWFKAQARASYKIRCVVHTASGAIVEIPARIRVFDGA